MGAISSIWGEVNTEIISASPADVLTKANDAGITLSNVVFKSEICVSVTVDRLQYPFLKSIVEHRGEKIRVLHRKGMFYLISNLRSRPFLMVGIVMLMILSLYLPTRVLFVEVEGNLRIPDRLIIHRAQQCGIGFGASRREVRSEKMKNALLSAIPELRWAGVNTKGCVAVITVLERNEEDENTQTAGVSNIVASRDGVICEATVLKGNLQCRVGQAVKRGQLLISGYTDCDRFIRVCDAEGEIKAYTKREIEIITPKDYKRKGKIFKEKTRYRLLVGKNIINFFKDSGISDTTCVKMYEQRYLSLPGGFQLPVALLIERIFSYDYDSFCDSESTDYLWIRDQAEQYLKLQMSAGVILSKNDSFLLDEDVCRYNGDYSCVEMIGHKLSEEIMIDNGKRD